MRVEKEVGLIQQTSTYMYFSNNEFSSFLSRVNYEVPQLLYRTSDFFSLVDKPSFKAITSRTYGKVKGTFMISIELAVCWTRLEA